MNHNGMRVPTGVAGLDHVLHGGYPKGRVILVVGAPGTGKTTLGLHAMLAAVARGERTLFLSIAQSRAELELIAESHGMDLSGVHVHSPTIGPGSGARPVSVESEEAELVALLDDVHRQLETHDPDLFVFDSLLELRLLAASDAAYRREILNIRHRLRERQTTTLLLDHFGLGSGERHTEGIVHGVIRMEEATPLIGTSHRRLTVVKLRGSSFREGYHDFRIRTGGLEVFPRVIPQGSKPASPLDALTPPDETLAEILGGGLEYGTTTIISGQSGTGKSTLSTIFARKAAQDGAKAAMFLFEERPEVLRARSFGVGLDVEKEEAKATLTLHHVDPAEVSPGQFSHAVIKAVEEDGARVVVIDSLSGYLNALPARDNVLTHLRTLLQYLGRREVLTIVTVAQHGLLGEPPTTELDVSYLADSVILLRQYQQGSEIRRSIAVLKKRHSEHGRSILEYVIRRGAVEIKPLSGASAARARDASELGER